MRVPLRARLAIVFASSFAVLLAAGAGITFWLFRRQLYRDFDRSLSASAETAKRLFQIDRAEQGTPTGTVAHIVSELPFGDRTLVAYDSLGRKLVTSVPTAGMPRFDDAPADAPTTRPATMALRRGTARVLAIELEDRIRVVIAMSTATVDRQLAQLKATIVAMLPFVLLIGGAVGGWGAGFVLRPVNRVAQLADEVGQAALAGEVNFSKLPIPRGRDEITTVSTAFNHLVDRLSVAIGRERRIAEQQRSFLADAAHELRTPVAIIRNEAEVALQSAAERSHEDSFATIADEAGRLGELVADLLFLARGTDPEPASVGDRVFLDDLANHAVIRIRKLRESEGRTFRWRECEAAPVRAPAHLIERAIMVLLHNALLHAPGSAIDLSTGVLGSVAWIRVRDYGPGIPSADRERIFDRFVRLRTTGPGSGLGLAIARAVAVQFGGQLALEDVSPGSSFVLTLPADPTSRA